jgi:hypothetical protein
MESGYSVFIVGVMYELCAETLGCCFIQREDNPCIVYYGESLHSCIVSSMEPLLTAGTR